MRIAVDGRNLVARRTGIARYFVEICEALAARGHAITFFLPSPPADATALPRFARSDVAGYPGSAARMVWSATALPARVRRMAPDVFWGPAHRLPPGLLPDLARVVTVHDLVWRHAPGTMRLRGRIADRMLMGHAIANADMICVNSDATGRDVAARYPDAAGRLRTVYPAANHVAGIRDAPTADDLKLRFGIEPPYVLFVGTLEPRKNLERLIRAFALLDEPVRSRHRLVICGGSGWKSRSPGAVADQFGVGNRVTVTGRVTDRELAGLYAHAHCLALPSLLEGFGMPILEAHRFGVPVITSNVSSMPEAAGEGGVLVDPGDTSSIAAGLTRLLTDRTFHAALATGARKNCARFSPELSASAMETALAEAIAMRKAATLR